MKQLVMLFLMLAACACSSIDCPVDNTVSTQYAICDASGAAAQLDDTLWVWTQRKDGNDTLLLNRGVGLKTFSLPISYDHPEDTLVFCVADTLGHFAIDTVWLGKRDIPHFESVDCAAHFFHELTNVRSTHRAIDTISINNPSVTYDQTVTHLQICFKAHQ